MKKARHLKLNLHFVPDMMKIKGIIKKDKDRSDFLQCSEFKPD